MAKRRHLWIVIVAALAASLPAIDSLARPKHPTIEIPPPPPPPPGPVGLPGRMIDDAAAYEAFLNRASAIAPTFTSPIQVAAARDLGAGYETKALIRGAVAYGAVAALQTPEFVAALRAAGPTPQDRYQMVNAIIANPAYVFTFKGSDTAAGLAKQAIGVAAMRLYNAGVAVKQASYDVQKQAWSKADVADRPGRLASVKSESEGTLQPDPAGAALLRAEAAGGEPMTVTADRAAPPYATLLERALQLAAIAALGEATDDTYDRMTYLTFEGDAAACLDRAKRNLFQCLAVAKPNYEDIFCTGQHELQDTGECLARSAGVPVPLVLDRPAPLRIPPVRRAAAAAHKRRH